MSTPEESPAQRAARLRRERREAKIKEGGSARLDKITKTSGRTHQSSTKRIFNAAIVPIRRPQIYLFNTSSLYLKY